MANYKKLAKGYFSKALDALKVLLSKKSVYDATSIAEGAPFGKGVKTALDFVAKLGRDYGFKVDTCQGYATELTAGSEGPIVGIYAHADVVPASGNWTTKNPFEPQVVGEGKEAKLIARGASDDKGPLIAAFYAMKLLKDNGLLRGFRVRMVVGGDEERGSSCLHHYFETLKKPHCDLGFTPDAEFPLIFAEKGMAKKAFLRGKVDCSPIIGMDGGVVSNAVCDKVILTLPRDKKFVEAFASSGLNGEITEEKDFLIVVIKGISAHGSTPEKGVNAALKAMEFIGSFYQNASLISLAKTLSDPFGTGFGGDHVSPVLGKSTYNYGLVHYDSTKKDLSLSLDYRYGETAKPKEALAALEKATGLTVTSEGFVEPLYYDLKSTLVSTLMKSYRRSTFRLFDKPMAIGGGTYAKEAKNTVAFGSAFKGHDGAIHSPDEYIYLEDFYAQIAIYADAIASLGKALTK
ncbi:MAG: Sapep family Mn(2+)-dependent dipeptidase [Candidatus Enteromonas sp.]|nr:Sapep family Mn(2+)-dependent dipeptidase [Candidatus Enteromonas sp.]